MTFTLTNTAAFAISFAFSFFLGVAYFFGYWRGGTEATKLGIKHMDEMHKDHMKNMDGLMELHRRAMH